MKWNKSCHKQFFNTVIITDNNQKYPSPSLELRRGVESFHLTNLLNPDCSIHGDSANCYPGESQCGVVQLKTLNDCLHEQTWPLCHHIWDSWLDDMERSACLCVFVWCFFMAPMIRLAEGGKKQYKKNKIVIKTGRLWFSKVPLRRKQTSKASFLAMSH